MNENQNSGTAFSFFLLWLPRSDGFDLDDAHFLNKRIKPIKRPKTAKVFYRIVPTGWGTAESVRPLARVIDKRAQPSLKPAFFG
jgi:hypothetical protein